MSHNIRGSDSQSKTTQPVNESSTVSAAKKAGLNNISREKLKNSGAVNKKLHSLIRMVSGITPKQAQSARGSSENTKVSQGDSASSQKNSGHVATIFKTINNVFDSIFNLVTGREKTPKKPKSESKPESKPESEIAEDSDYAFLSDYDLLGDKKNEEKSGSKPKAMEGEQKDEEATYTVADRKRGANDEIERLTYKQEEERTEAAKKKIEEARAKGDEKSNDWYPVDEKVEGPSLPPRNYGAGEIEEIIKEGRAGAAGKGDEKVEPRPSLPPRNYGAGGIEKRIEKDRAGAAGKGDGKVEPSPPLPPRSYNKVEPSPPLPPRNYNKGKIVQNKDQQLNQKQAPPAQPKNKAKRRR